MPQLGKFSAWIEVDGKHLPEYGSTIADDMETISCWIPSEAGKEFAVCWKDSNSLYALEGSVFVDGFSCGGICDMRWTMNGEATHRKAYVKTSGSAGRALMFSTIELTDDDSYLRQHSQVENLGEIKIELYEVKILGTSSSQGLSADALSANAKVHERSKKGMGHRIGLGRAVQNLSTYGVQRDRIRCVTTFIFRYRPLAILQANEIAPLIQSNKRKASTPPQDSSDDEDEGTPEQIEVLKAKLRKLEGRQKKRIKSEVEVKTEPASSSSQPIKHLGFIDLTED